jgi:hypothetical protein
MPGTLAHYSLNVTYIMLRLVEEALSGWLQSQITRIDQRLAASTRPLREEYGELSKLAQT